MQRGEKISSRGIVKREFNDFDIVRNCLISTLSIKAQWNKEIQIIIMLCVLQYNDGIRLLKSLIMNINSLEEPQRNWASNQLVQRASTDMESLSFILKFISFLHLHIIRHIEWNWMTWKGIAWHGNTRH